MSGKKIGSALTKLRTTIFDRSVNEATKLQWTTIFDVGLCVEEKERE